MSSRLAALDAIDDAAVQRFQPAWATRAHLLAKAGRSAEAATAYRRAIDLTSDGGVLDYLRRRLAAVAREDTSADTPRGVGGPP